MITGLQKVAGVLALALGVFTLYICIRIVQQGIIPPAHRWPNGAWACAVDFWNLLARSGPDSVITIIVGGLGVCLIIFGTYFLFRGPSDS